MAVVSADVRAGDPTIQASGQYRGTVDVTLDDGRDPIAISIRAPDQDSWNDQVAAAGAKAQARAEDEDAEESVDPDADIEGGHKQAGRRKRALAYIRRAARTGEPYLAYRLLTRFNSYRVAQGWSVAQAKTALLAVGATDEEVQDAVDRFQFLRGGGRPATMEAYWNSVVVGDTWGADYR